MSAQTTTWSAWLAAMLIGIASLGAQREVAAQRPQADVRIIRAVDASSDTLQVTVEYMYRDELPAGGVKLLATPEEEGGIFDPKIVQWDEVPVRRGVFTHTLTITSYQAPPTSSAWRWWYAFRPRTPRSCAEISLIGNGGRQWRHRASRCRHRRYPCHNQRPSPFRRRAPCTAT